MARNGSTWKRISLKFSHANAIISFHFISFFLKIKVRKEDEMWPYHIMLWIDLMSRIIFLLMTSLGGGAHPRKIHCIPGSSMSLLPGCHVPSSSFLCHTLLYATLPHYSPLALDWNYEHYSLCLFVISHRSWLSQAAVAFPGPTDE